MGEAGTGLLASSPTELPPSLLLKKNSSELVTSIHFPLPGSERDDRQTKQATVGKKNGV